MISRVPGWLQRLFGVPALGAVVVAMGIVLLVWFRWSGVEEHAVAPAAVDLQAPDFYMSGVEQRRYTAEGQQDYRLVAAHWERPRGARHSRLVQLQFWLGPAAGAAQGFRAEAASGTLYAEVDRLNLNGGVAFWQPLPGGLERRFRTAALDVQLDTREAHGTDPVELTAPGTWIWGEGVEADLTQGRFSILGRVRAEHQWVAGGQ